MAAKYVSKLVFSIIATGLTSSAALATNGITFNEPTMAGSGCYQMGASTVETSDSEIQVKTAVLVKKDEADTGSLKRSVCTVALPFQLDAGKKLVLKDVMFSGFVNLATTVTAKAQTEVFLAGGHGDIQKIEIEAAAKRQKKFVSHTASLDLESACGVAGIFRTNTSGIIQGGENLRSTLRMDGLTTKFEIQDCEE